MGTGLARWCPTSSRFIADPGAGADGGMRIQIGSRSRPPTGRTGGCSVLGSCPARARGRPGRSRPGPNRTTIAEPLTAGPGHPIASPVRWAVACSGRAGNPGLTAPSFSRDSRGMLTGSDQRLESMIGIGASPRTVEGTQWT